MSEADILALTYEDTCRVYRPCRKQLPSGESVFRNGLDGQLVYEDIPCAMSSPSGGKLSQTPSTAHTPTDYCLFLRPEVAIEPNDTLVIQHLGQTVTALSGLPERHKSHNNIPLILSEDTV